ncbi:MAG: class II aldolase/adducin family protein [Verrucomicrobiae bacterium]|nr:class II aldolase/adducin family protein [Verrucomicrobiae bacterium]
MAFNEQAPGQIRLCGTVVKRYDGGMAEEYVGTKFKTIFCDRTPPQHEHIAELILWCQRFAEKGWAPGWSGNLSIRSRSGFIVTRTGAKLADLKSDELIEVIKVDRKRREVTVVGAYEPSSESLMHSAIYEARPDVCAVFHGHHDFLIARAEELKLPTTEIEKPYGTTEVVEEILKVLGQHRFLIIRNHGFLALGATMKEAGEQIDAVCRKLERMTTP